MLKWFKVAQKEPPDDTSVVIYNNGFPHIVDYLPPRWGDDCGDWKFPDGEEYQTKPSDYWIDIDELFSAAALNGEVFFKEVRTKQKSK